MTAREAPASVGQRLLWFLDRYRGQTGALNCPMICRVHGRADETALRAAVDDLAARHDSLRTTFAGGGRELRQVIHEPAPVPVTTVDLRAEPDPEAALRAAIATDLRTRVDPRRAPLRVTGWRVGEDDRVLALTMHHLVTDTWSCDVLFTELAAAYERAVRPAGGADPGGDGQPATGWQPTQFAAWQERQLRGPAGQRHRDYWEQQLAGVRPPGIPVSPAGDGGGRRAVEHAAVDPAVGRALRELARAERTTPFTVLLAGYYTLLHRLTAADDLAVATLFANRTRPELQRTVGFLANMVVLRAQLPPRATFVDVVRRSRQTVIDAFAHQELPYHLLARRTERAGGLRPDDLVFQMLAEPIDVTVAAGGVQFQGVVPDVVGRFDLELALMPRGDGYAAKLYYTADRLSPGWAADFIAGYAQTAAAVAAEPLAPIADLRMSR